MGRKRVRPLHKVVEDLKMTEASCRKLIAAAADDLNNNRLDSARKNLQKAESALEAMEHMNNLKVMI